MSIQPWFPTFVYKAPLLARTRDRNRFNRELLAESLQIRDHDADGRAWSAKSYPGGFTSYGSMSRLHKFSSTFMELEKRIDRHVARFARHLDYDLTDRELVMTDCWVNIMPTSVAHGSHIHPLSTISGTYYVQTPRGCSAIKFEDPRLQAFMAQPPRRPDAKPHNKPHVAYAAETGHVVLFESWLRHEVPPNTTVSERISISFNYNWF
ncbi:TIGR02466 family protein [Opitutales bacterium ASA1]|uniref:TIGR02466 family protein n=1 Tax=Congregicoccus parvus TaxID=3081749 RepID=UPI002B2E4E30|nr:TIGR02466 family protein [Opitutales bacterium ASA1]